jgi:hypothetical protein
MVTKFDSDEYRGQLKPRDARLAASELAAFSLLQKWCKWLLSTHYRPFPHDTGWTAVDRGRAKTWIEQSR